VSKDARIAELDAERVLHILQARAEKAEAALAEAKANWKYSRIRDLEAQLTERRDRVDDLDKALEAANARIAEVEAHTVSLAIYYYDTAKHYTAQLADRDRQIAALREVMDLWYDAKCDCEMCCLARAALQQDKP
jgi:chromosome segregation ATPase